MATRKVTPKAEEEQQPKMLKKTQLEEDEEYYRSETVDARDVAFNDDEDDFDLHEKTWIEGYEAGNDAGWREGYSEGRIEGLKEGVFTSFEQGYHEGVFVGHAEALMFILHERYGRLPKVLMKEILTVREVNFVQGLLKLAYDTNSLKYFRESLQKKLAEYEKNPEDHK